MCGLPAFLLYTHTQNPGTCIRGTPAPGLGAATPGRVILTLRAPAAMAASYVASESIDLVGGYTLRSVIEAPLITREVLPVTYFLSVIMAADARARPFLQFQASC